MFDEDIHTLSSSSSLDLTEEICDFIQTDAFFFPATSGTIQEHEFSQSSEDSTTMDLESDKSSSEEIPFDQSEWLTRDPSTNRIRPPMLYEFLHLLLNNLRYMSYATWLNKNEGLFRIHKPQEVAELWNQVKIRHTNNTMTFAKFSRSIRSYYPTGKMIGTRKRYTYRFAIQK